MFGNDKTPKGIQNETMTGIQLMDYSAEMKWICVVVQRSVVFVDPFTMEISQILEVLSSPAVGLKVNDAMSHFVVACRDKTIRVHHTASYALLQMIVDRCEYSPNQLSSAFYEPSIGRFYTAGNRLFSWRVERTSAEEVEAQQLRLLEPLHDSLDRSEVACLLYAASSEQVLVLEKAGIARTYSALNGDLAGYFSMRQKLREGQHWVSLVEGLDFESIAHSLQVHVACLDFGDRRLFVCTTDHVLTVWNFRNAECLHVFCPVLFAEGGMRHFRQRQKVVDIAYAQIESQETIRYLLISFGGTVQCHRESEGFKRVASKHLTLPAGTADQPTETDREVMWTRVWRTSLIAAYSDGSLILWDLQPQSKDGNNFSHLTTSVRSGNRRQPRKTYIDRIRSIEEEALVERAPAATKPSKEEEVRPAATASKPKDPVPSARRKLNRRIRVGYDGRVFLSGQTEGPSREILNIAAPQDGPPEMRGAPAPELHPQQTPPTRDDIRPKKGYSVISGSVGVSSGVLFGACSDNLIRVWKLPEGAQLGHHDTSRDVRRTPDAADEAMVIADFHEESSYLAVGYELGNIRLWALNKEALAGNRLHGGHIQQTSPILGFVAQWMAHLSRVSAGRNNSYSLAL